MCDAVSSSGETSGTLTIAVEGNIGCGKSTFLQHCALRSDIAVFPEPVDKWQNLHGVNVLRNFYTDPQNWSFPFQLYAGVTVLANYKTSTAHKLKLVERSLGSARNVFFEEMKQQNLIEPTLGRILDTWYDITMQEHSANPQVIVYLRTSPSVAYERLQNRGRDAEVGVTLQYITRIHQLHERWIEGIRERELDPYDPILPVFVIDADRPREQMPAAYEACLTSLYDLASM